jgi:hypothetical protein
MADNREIFQLYLIGQMRYLEGVKIALSVMGASKHDARAAREIVVQRGFEEPVVAMSMYEQFLGQPEERGEDEDEEPHQRTWTAYHFRLWPTLRVVMFGSSNGAVSGLRFERRTGMPTPPMVDPENLEPWRTILTDLDSTDWPRVTRENWYPIVDLEIEWPPTSVRALLQFDFNLLQLVHVLQP